MVDARGGIRLRKDDCPRSVFRARWRDYDETARTYFSRTIARNAVGPGKKRQGYGIITGEPEAERYFASGKLRLLPGDTVLFFTDGFAPYVSDRAFRRRIAATALGRDTKEAVDEFVNKKLVPMRRRLRDSGIAGWMPTDQIIMKMRRLFGSRYADVAFCLEKTLIAVRAEEVTR